MVIHKEELHDICLYDFYSRADLDIKKITDTPVLKFKTLHYILKHRYH